MREWVSDGVHVDGDGEMLRAAFAGDPAAWLPPPAVPLDRNCWLVSVRWHGNSRAIPCRLLPYRDDGSAGWRHLVWDPTPEEERDRPPHLEAELGLLVPRGSGAQLTLTGIYAPPFGVFAIRGETAALYRATVAAVRGFLGDLAATLAAGVHQIQATEGNRKP